MNSNKKIIVILIFVSLFFISLSTYLFVDGINSGGIRYPYLANRIQVDSPNNIKLNFTALRTEMTDYINNLNGLSEKVSVYFEYLPTGVAININEKNEVVGASLMKVPVVMNMYKEVEKNNVDLSKKIQLKNEWLNSDYGTLYQKGAGYELTLRQAAEYTLKDSDNTGLLAIWDTFKMQDLDMNGQSLSYMDVEFDVLKDQRVLIGARSYSSILKCLYFSCFNTLEHSNEILSYLSKSSFTDRLTKYIPEDIKVSHKIGTFSQSFQSDCGIFYVPKENYVLCVMVEGTEEQASKIISDISRKAYSFIKDKEELR